MIIYMAKMEKMNFMEMSEMNILEDEKIKI